ncbi:hypothetical protein, partial [Romboutsia ilealis]|uniref:hypothetical protein n=1 Tax=Romboutsia ilealis TaxID=1115758 RepID=UPI0026F3BF16
MGKDLFTIYASIISIIGFILQLLNINDTIKKIILVLSLISLFILLVWLVFNSNLTTFNALIKNGNYFINSAKEKVVLFCGDLSWIDYYSNTILEVRSKNKKVEIFLPQHKYNYCMNNLAFKKMILNFKKNNVDIFVYENDEGIRGLLLDPDTYNSPEVMEIVIADKVRIKNKFLNMLIKKDIYIQQHFEYKNHSNRKICNLYISKSPTPTSSGGLQEAPQ